MTPGAGGGMSTVSAEEAAGLAAVPAGAVPAVAEAVPVDDPPPWTRALARSLAAVSADAGAVVAGLVSCDASLGAGGGELTHDPMSAMKAIGSKDGNFI